MSYEEVLFIVVVVVEVPHVCLYADAARADGGEERLRPPVVVVRVAGDGDYVPQEIRGISG